MLFSAIETIQSYLFHMRYLAFFIFLLVSCRNQPASRLQTFAPSDGKVLYFSHQNTYQNDKKHLFGSGDRPLGPAGLVVYTSLIGSISTNFIEGRTVEDLGPFFKEHKDLTPILVLGIDKSLYGRLQQGEFDEGLERIAFLIKALERPVYLSLGVEVNSPLYMNDPSKFVDAYRYCADKIRSFNVPDLSLVWYVVGMNPGYEERDVMEWYPGDEYVNWLGISVFKITEDHFAEKTKFTDPNYDRLIEVSRTQQIPIMVIESSASTIIRDFGFKDDTLWNFWYRPFFSFIEENEEIKAVCHVTQDWVLDDVIWQRWKEKLGESRYLFSDNKVEKHIR